MDGRVVLQDEQDQEGVGLGESMVLYQSTGQQQQGGRLGTAVDLDEPNDWDATHSRDLIQVHAW